MAVEFTVTFIQKFQNIAKTAPTFPKTMLR